MESKKNVMVIFGTRPEAIKLAPVLKELEKSTSMKPVSVATAQHRGLMDQVLDFFNIQPDFDLNLMKPNQDLFYTMTECLNRIKDLIAEVQPSLLVVQGDTTTAFTAALAAFYHKTPVAHVEAGLRTYYKYSPFPEEMNRRLISPLAELHFAPTKAAKSNLLREGISENSISVTGNTSIDALLLGCTQKLHPPRNLILSEEAPLIILTLHRRENFGAPLTEIFSAIKKFAIKYSHVQIVYPVHPNPNVKETAHSLLKNIPNISLIEPVDYKEMLYLMKRSQFILTDSGGIQEEAPSLGKPVLVLRESTERAEAVEAGCAYLVGHHSELIFRMMETLLDKTSQFYLNMSSAKNPFGDGTASQKIINRIEHFFRGVERNKLPWAA